MCGSGTMNLLFDRFPSDSGTKRSWTTLRNTVASVAFSYFSIHAVHSPRGLAKCVRSAERSFRWLLDTIINDTESGKIQGVGFPLFPIKWIEPLSPETDSSGVKCLWKSPAGKRKLHFCPLKKRSAITPNDPRASPIMLSEK